MARDASEVDEIEGETGTSACTDRKRKRISNADDSEKPLGMGPAVREDTEEVMREQEETDAPIDLGCMEDMDSLIGHLAGERDAPMAQYLEQPSNKPSSCPFMVELQRIKQKKDDLEKHHPFLMELQSFDREINDLEKVHAAEKLELFEAKEVQMDNVWKHFEKQFQQLELKFIQQKLLLDKLYQKVVKSKELADLFASMFPN